MLKLKEVSGLPSLKDSKLIYGKEKLNISVSGAMVMEALDIEDWGSPRQILMTSNFAFKDETSETIIHFFKKAKEIGISAFIFKKNRLVSEIPEYFISNCKMFGFPLFEVKKDITYESIINDILKLINNRNTLLLQSYYDNHQQFIQLMMNQSGTIKILETLSTLIGVPVSLVEKANAKVIGTKERYNLFEFKNAAESMYREFNSLEYEQRSVNYPNIKTQENNKLLSFTIPNLGYEQYQLIIHGADYRFSDMDFMAITNTIIAIQTELVKKYALRQNKKARMNEMVSDLVHGRLTNQEDINETINNLELNPDKKYRVIVFNFSSKKRELSDALVNRLTDTLTNLFRNKFNNLLYIGRKDQVSLITSTENMTINNVKKKIETILKKISENKSYKDIYHYISISNEVSLYKLTEGHRQAMDSQKILRMGNEESAIVSYENLGLYRLFLETDNLNSLDRFVPENLKALQKDNPDLLNTLYVFINVNQNYSEASEILFIHPKTVRYRINRLKERYDIDLKNPEEILQYSIALRILKFIPLENQNNPKYRS
ncbi:MAG: PucR family transcriptional regulator ligand-binding domain-containing protein [Alkalibacterium sp.]|nr:PucR family transcriptional regulator ligand-binding domain-containing protein [Alkalibacterium sp.]